MRNIVTNLCIVLVIIMIPGFCQSDVCRAGKAECPSDTVHPIIHYMPYTRPLRQGGVLFVEDPGDSLFGPPTKPDPLWQGTLDVLFGSGNYGWYGPTLSKSENGPDSIEMMDYELVIWNCYDYWLSDTAALTAEDTTHIAAYLNNQGSVWLIGHDVLWSGVSLTFMKTYFHLESVIQDYLHDIPDINLHGLNEIDSFSILATSDYSRNNFWPDALTPDSDAHVVLEDADMSENVGIFYPGQGIWQSAFWAIDGRSANPYSEWINMVTGMINAFGITGIEEIPGQQATQQLDLMISPDPVVHVTRFEYTLSEPGLVKLDIYDLSGQHVITIVNESRSAGPHADIWDIRDDDGTRVPSGVYIARVICGVSCGNASFVVIE